MIYSVMYLIWSVGIFAKTRLTDYRHAGIVGDPLQLLCKIPQSVLSDSPGGRKTRNRPFPDFHTCEKLLAPHIPNSLIGQCLLLSAASIL